MTGEGTTYLVYGIDGDLDVVPKDGTDYGIPILTRVDHPDHEGNPLLLNNTLQRLLERNLALFIAMLPTSALKRIASTSVVASIPLGRIFRARRPKMPGSWYGSLVPFRRGINNVEIP